MEASYFHILYAPLNSIVKLKISSGMNFLTNKKSLDVFENCIKIEQKKFKCRTIHRNAAYFDR